MTISNAIRDRHKADLQAMFRRDKEECRPLYKENAHIESSEEMFRCHPFFQEEIQQSLSTTCAKEYLYRY